MYCRHGGVVQSGASCYTAASVIRRYEDIIKKVIYYLARNLLVVNAEIGYIILANLAENSTRKYQKCGRWLSFTEAGRNRSALPTFALLESRSAS